MAGVRKITLRFPKKEMLPKITNKQIEIIKYIYHFRFLNRIQIQALLKHKDYRLINEWLKDLTEKEYLKRNYSERYGERNKPAVYYIGPNGIKFIKTMVNCSKEQLKKLHRESDRKDTFISNCQFLADVYLDLKAKSNGQVKYSIKTKSEFIDPNSPLHFLTETNADMLIEETEGVMKKYYLLEILDDSLPGYSIKKRIKNYIDLYFSNSWEDATGAGFPTVVLICETLPMMMGVKRMTNKLVEEDELRKLMHFVTKKERLDFAAF